MDHGQITSSFHSIAGFVVDTYRDLLEARELHWYETLRCAPFASQCLYIRLLSRRGSTFRLGRLDYAEIDNLDTASSVLAERGLASRDCPQELSALLACFTKPELLQILDLQAVHVLSRVELVRFIEGAEPSVVDDYVQRLQQADRWVTLEGYSHWMLFQLCFFGNLYQDSRELVLHQLGTLRYETYPLDASARAFTSRAQIEAHWRYFESEVLLDCCNKNDSQALLEIVASLPENTIVNDVNLTRRLDRIRNRIARQLERLACIDDAQRLYQQSVHPPARERRVRIFLSTQCWSQAEQLARAMLETPHNESERLTGMRLLRQCQKALGQAYQRTRVFKPLSSKLVLNNTGVRVEELARRFYSGKGECFHTENALVTGVLGLFIWDIIFYPVSGVFFNRFQAAPADFHQSQFLLRRKALIEKRFEELEDKVAFGARIQSAFSLHFGKVNPLVSWQRLSSDVLSLAVDRVPVQHWRALFERVLTDTRENSTGLPDLVLFPQNGRYEFIEIKGPGDALQAHQRRWMQYFNEHDICYRLVHVRYRSGVPAVDTSREAIDDLTENSKHLLNP